MRGFDSHPRLQIFSRIFCYLATHVFRVPPAYPSFQEARSDHAPACIPVGASGSAYHFRSLAFRERGGVAWRMPGSPGRTGQTWEWLPLKVPHHPRRQECGHFLRFFFLGGGTIRLKVPRNPLLEVKIS